MHNNPLWCAILVQKLPGDKARVCIKWGARDEVLEVHTKSGLHLENPSRGGENRFSKILGGGDAFSNFNAQ